MSDKPCYKEDSLRDFATWAMMRGHYVVAPLIKNYLEYVKERKELLDVTQKQ